MSVLFHYYPLVPAASLLLLLFLFAGRWAPPHSFAAASPGRGARRTLYVLNPIALFVELHPHDTLPPAPITGM